MKKLQSLDSKAIKLALGIPVHATTLGTYRKAGILPLDETPKLVAAAAKYIITVCPVVKHTNAEVELRSEIFFFFFFFLKVNENLGLLTIASYTSDLFQKAQMNPRNVAKCHILSNSRPGTDEGRLRYRLHGNEERSESQYSVI